ncbi:MAG TPA: hypothetical protein VGO80_07905 [Solirubrobacteraceae bacterium]|jgi:uncharacterized protein YukE|nr:hypothetical protein [Solirubrobacteraceae bacterium]
MPELTNAEPITFDFDAADGLAAQLRATASFLRAQAPHRNGLADAARTDWRGAYEVKFGERMQVCTRDAQRLADAMIRAADQVKELARLAREEQDRRTQAAEWKVEHDAWEREQADRNLGERIVDLFGDDEPEPPTGTPADPPHFPITAPDLANRE